MPILNYTTQIDPMKTIGEITKILNTLKISGISTTFDIDANPTSLIFSIPYEGKILNFCLPCNHKGVLDILKKQNVATKFKTEEQAFRVGWRIIKDLVEAKVAVIQSNLLVLLQEFLPYLVLPNGNSLFNEFLTTNKLQLC
jgi:hypothetical protein